MSSSIVCIRFTDGDDIRISIPNDSTIDQLKSQLEQNQPHLANKRLRLIYRGRILQDHQTVGSLHISNSTTNFSSSPTDPSLSPLLQHDPREVLFIHCAVSDAIGSVSSSDPTSSTINNTNINTDTNNTTPSNTNDATPNIQTRTGFNRLLDVGFTQAEVDTLRNQFHNLRGTQVAVESEEANRVEEEWMENNGSGLDDGLDGSRYDMLIGLLMGFFLGVIVFFWIRERGVFTRKRQIGALAGLFLNLSFGILRVYGF